MLEQDKKSSALQNLWNRRFFQYLGTYLGLSFGLIQFMDFLVNRYDLDSNLVDKLFIFLLALLPAVAVFIYNHGRPGHDRWRPFEKVFLPISLIIGFSLAMLLFNDSSARAATEEISIATLEGKRETRMVPKVEFTKRFAIFPFDDNTGKEEERWKRIGIAYLLDKDLEQFMMNYVINPVAMKSQYTSYNANFLDPIPFSTQLKIAQEYYTDYFIIGNFDTQEGKVQLNAKVHDTKNGQLFYETSIEGQDIYEVTDKLSDEFTKAIYPKDNLPQLEYVDLPATDLITGDMEALKAYIESLAIYTNNALDASKAIEKMEVATGIDPNCAACYSVLAEMYFADSKEAEMKAASDKAVSLAASLPERQKLNINYLNYIFYNQIDKAQLMLNNWAKLYPHDYTPYTRLMNFYLQRLMWDRAEAIGLKALENGHRGNLLYSLATLYINKREFDEAEKYIDQYYDLYPHKSKDHSLLEQIYTGKGELSKAKSLSEDALIMNPGDVETIIKLGTLEDKLGNFTQAEQLFQQAFTKSRNVQDSVNVYNNLALHYERLGQYGKVFDSNEQAQRLMQKYVPPAQLKQQKFFGQGYRMVVAQRKDTYFSLLEELKTELPQNAALFDCIGNYLFHMWSENEEEFETYSDKCLEPFIIPMYGKSFLVLDKAARAEIRGDFPQAIEAYRAYQDSTGMADVRMNFGLASVYRKNADYAEALQLIDELLKSDPNDPIILLEKARILADQGKTKLAAKEWDRVMEIWKDADEDYEYYQEALELGESLKNNS